MTKMPSEPPRFSRAPRHGLLTCAVVLTLAACSHTSTEPVSDGGQPQRSDATRTRTNAPTRVEEVVIAESAVMMEDASLLRAMPAPAGPHVVTAGLDPRLALPHGEDYPELDPAGVRTVATDPVSTFSMDVDTAAYSNVRRLLEQGMTPPVEAVRIEEMVNYFRYDHARPRAGEGFALTTEVAPSPTHADRHLLMVGLSAEVPEARLDRPRNLVLLVDTSGSMQSPDKLPLLQRAFGLLVDQLDEDDRISLVAYAGRAGVVLEPTPGNERTRILGALERLAAGGSTHGSAGISTAYALAREHFDADGVNRVILATDGDFNVGVSDPDDLVDLIDRQRHSGIGLTVLGFGSGNYDDATAQALAQHGDGIAAYIDGLAGARRVLVDQLDAQLHTVARDARIQVEFNPARVAEYRLLGYETRAMAREDFEDDAVDAGDIGAGHQVTALYEIALVGSGGERVRPLRYAQDEARPTDLGDELAHVRVRWLAPRDDADATGGRIERPVLASRVQTDLADASADLRFAAAVAGLGELLRGGRHAGDLDYETVTRLAREARGEDPRGDRGAFLGLVRLAETVAPARVAGRP